MLVRAYRVESFITVFFVFVFFCFFLFFFVFVFCFFVFSFCFSVFLFFSSVFFCFFFPSFFGFQYVIIHRLYVVVIRTNMTGIKLAARIVSYLISNMLAKSPIGFHQRATRGLAANRS